jgi:hypothetical protein
MPLVAHETTELGSPVARNRGYPGWDLLGKALAAIAGGITLGGFVTVVGGALLWARFDAAHLPADPAIAVVPDRELAVTGFSTLIPFLAMALLVTLVMYIVDPTATVRTEPKHEGRQEEDRSIWTRLRWIRALLDCVASRTGLKDAWLRVLVLVVAEMLIFFLVHGYNDLDLILIALAAAVGAAIASVAVAAHTYGFRWFAVTAFLSAALFGALVTYLFTVRSPQVRPAAILLMDNRVVTGLYVAQTSERVYVSVLTPDQDNEASEASEAGTCNRSDRTPDLDEVKGIPKDGRMLSYPRDQVISTAIGQLQTICEALDRTSSLVGELRSMEQSGAP